MQNTPLWLHLNRNSDVSLAQQIVQQLRDRVLAGTLAAGDTLPSSRALAHELGISRSVVVRAYEQLNGEGYLESAAGSATKIAEGVLPLLAEASGPHGDDTTSTHYGRSDERSLRRTSARTAIDLGTGNPVAGISVPEEWRKELQRAARAPLSSYAPLAQGDPTLREQIATHARRARGLNCSAEDVIVTSGTVDSLLLITLALGHQAKWGMEDPGYQEAARVLRLGGAAVQPIPLRGQSLTLSDLERLALISPTVPPSRFDALLVTPSHQFPLGGVMPAADRAALLEWARSNRVLLVEDDYDSEFRYVGSALPAIAALDPGGVVAHIGSLNKSFSPSLRCGYVITTAGSDIWRSLLAAKRTVGQSVPQFVQSATASFFESGGFRRYVAKARREYRHRRGVLISQLSAAGLASRLSGTEGGLHAMLQLPSGVSARAVARELAHEGVLIDTLGDFTQLGAAPEAIAIGYGAEPVTRLAHGVQSLIRAIAQAQTGAAADPAAAAAAAAAATATDPAATPAITPLERD